MRAIAWAALAGLVLAPVATYGGQLSGPFVFDDEQAITGNASIRALGSAALLSPPRETPVAARPLVNLSFAVDYALFGPNPGAFHAVNLALHALCVLIGFASLGRLLSSSALPAGVRASAEWCAFASALLFAVHPLASEVILYASQRTELLVAACYLGAMLVLIRAAASGERPSVLAAAALGVLGACSKEVFVTAPLLALFLDRAFYAGTFRRALRVRARFYAALSICLPVALALQIGAPRSQSVRFGEPAYLMAQAKVILGYFGAAFWPTSLAIDHGPLPLAIDALALAPWVIAMGLLALAAGVLAFTHPRLGFLGVWVLGILAPSSSVFSIHTEVGADRRFYLPLLGVCAYVVVGAAACLARALPVGRPIRALSFAAVALATLALAWTAHRHAASYASVRAVWQAVVRAYPENPRGHFNLGETYRREGDSQRAMASFRDALARKETYAEAHINLGNLLITQGALSQGLGHLQRGAQLAPGDADARYNLAIALSLTGHGEAALVELEECLRLEPGHAAARRKLEVANPAVDRKADARRHAGPAP